MKISFIGGGVMAEALIGGILGAELAAPEDILVGEPIEARRADLEKQYGLKARAQLSTSGDDETGFLEELQQIAETGHTPAERLLKRYQEVWNGDISQAFTECAF